MKLLLVLSTINNVRIHVFLKIATTEFNSIVCGCFPKIFHRNLKGKFNNGNGKISSVLGILN